MSSSVHTPPPAAHPWLSQPVVIDSILPETPGVATYRLRFQEPGAGDQYSFRPGQFNMLYVPGIGEIAISVSGADAKQTYAHTIRTVGNVTSRLAALSLGGVLGLRGPFGTSWPLAQARGADIVFVAGGIGLAPLRSAIYEVLAHRADYGQITLLNGARSPESLLYPSEYAAWQTQGMAVQTTVDQPSHDWSGRVGVVSLLLDRLPLSRPESTILLTCGPEVMMKYVVRSALRRGLTAEQVWCSLERNMQCAVGFCGHCQLGPAFICKDGPVLRYDRIAPYLAVERL